MSIEELENRICSISCAADSLIAVLDMTSELYFEETVQQMGPDYWVASHDQLCGVMEALRTLSAGIRDSLNELTKTKIKAEEAESPTSSGGCTR